jgi:predicted ATP-dependent protease
MKLTKTVKKFGEIAVEKGYVTQKDVEKILEYQKWLKNQGKNELIGILMLKQGMITNDQLIDILQYYDTEHRE